MSNKEKLIAPIDCSDGDLFAAYCDHFDLHGENPTYLVFRSRCEFAKFSNNEETGKRLIVRKNVKYFEGMKIEVMNHE